MPIPEKKKDEYKQPGLVSWQSFVFMGLVATAATGVLIGKGGFRMNRNLNAMNRFVSGNADKFGKLVEHTPSGKDKIFRQNVENILETAQKIAEDRLPDDKDKQQTQYNYPKPTFPSMQTSRNKRVLLSSKPKDNDNNDNNNNNNDDSKI